MANEAKKGFLSKVKLSATKAKEWFKDILEKKEND